MTPATCFVAGLLVLAANAEPRRAPAANTGTGVDPMALTLTSPAFKDNGEIPSQYTCEGPDKAPALSWSGVPQGTKSLALIVDDPDAPDPKAPRMVFVHWVLYNIPPEATGMPEGVVREGLPKGTREGATDFGKTGYGGPCPPIGRHRYFFKLYALDTVLSDLGHANKAAVEKAMHGHVLGQTQLVGTYQKKGRG
jgi:Raf kinase inhibitor-like YbhB/YbcL family protein